MQNEDSFLELIPYSSRTPEQLACWDTGVSPTYKLLRDPRDLQEFAHYGRVFAIWRDNGTLTYISTCRNHDMPHCFPKYLCLTFHDDDPTFYIVGKSDDAVAETAALFVDLKDARYHDNDFICIDNIGVGQLDFCAAGPQCLSRLFAISPPRVVILVGLTLSAEQSAVLATQSYPLKLTFKDCGFEDQGTAFVDALSTRRSMFGSLKFRDNFYMDISDDNLKRLFQVDVIHHLDLPLLSDEVTRLSFSAKVKSLDCCLSISSMDSDFESLNIVTSKNCISRSPATWTHFQRKPHCPCFNVWQNWAIWWN
ncbi:hypothetical protein FisN_26Hu151 [Fistulifera solaris]|uniref:Uncharacterized protein n=1 Tax=Fistulifera solaris TaxID=1519565 RepID=A0A1Z5JY63_FISSO|nr:hypothetical protein FisN_26Hu151 [Fistulifera solaris]|eukprot:GAX18849.1 hypothetical protein FisN_26Hu151 [Fistulifera solaris]